MLNWVELFEGTLDYVQVYDLEGRVCYTNQAFLRVLGYGNTQESTPEKQGMNLLDIVASSGKEKLWQHFKDTVDKKRGFSFETSFLSANKHPIFVRAQFSYMSLAPEMPAYIRGNFRDITHMVRAAKVQTLCYNISRHNFWNISLDEVYERIFEELYRFSDLTHFAIISHQLRSAGQDISFRCLSNNSLGEAEKEAQQKICTLLGKEVLDRGNPILVYHDRIKKLLGQQVKNMPLPYLWGGAEVPTLSPKKDLICIYSYDKHASGGHTDLDVLEFVGQQVAFAMQRIDRELEAKEQEAHFASLVESSTHQIWTVNAQYRLLSYNGNFFKALANYLGKGSVFSSTKTGDSALAPHVVSAMPKVAAQWKGYYDRALRGESISFEIAFLTKEAQTIWREVFITPVRLSGGRIVKLSVIAHDITEKKRDQERLVMAKEAAEQALKAKQAFLANMSHEIRTPINGIIGTLSLMEGQLPSTELENNLQVAKRSSVTLLSMLNDILQFSKMKTGKLQIRMSATSVPAMLNKLLDLFAHEAQVHQIPILLRIDKSVDHPIEIDETRTLQVLSNLTSNALKFSSSKHPVVIKAKVEDPDSMSCKSVLYIAIEDRGIGVDEVALPLLFQSFSQVESSTKKLFKGTGLGLAISKELVNLMGGEIGVESAKGEGSTFWFRIPVSVLPALTKKMPATTPPEELPLLEALQARVLVVDDNEVNASVCRDLLLRTQVGVEVASSGKEAIKMVKKHAEKPFDLILMDVQMPKQDGIETAKRLRALGLYLPPIVAMTAYALAHDKVRFLLQGFDHYLPKPVQADVLFEGVGRWIKLDRLLRKLDKEKLKEKGIIDLGALAAHMQRTQLLDAFKLFEKEATLLLEKVLEGLIHDKEDEVGQHLHSLKGAAGTLGITRLYHSVSQVEKSLAELAEGKKFHLLEGVLEDFALFRRHYPHKF